jgi:hypothetical protein
MNKIGNENILLSWATVRSAVRTLNMEIVTFCMIPLCLCVCPYCNSNVALITYKGNTVPGCVMKACGECAYGSV